MFTRHWTNLFLFCCFFEILGFRQSQAQPLAGTWEVKWLWIGSLRQSFSSTCSEIEYGRRGRGPYLNTDQDDGLRWPAQYQFQDHNVGKGLWIGTINFKDPSRRGNISLQNDLPWARGHVYRFGGVTSEVPTHR